MKLTVATMARNEEKFIPYFIHHYSDIADEIVLIDNESTDNTAKIAHEMCSKFKVPLVYKYLQTNGFNESIKLNVYKAIQKNELNTNSDWYILVDCDELIHYKDGSLKQKIEEYYDNGYLFIKPKGYQMSEESFPIYSNSKITETCKMGTRDEGFDKPVIVHKDLLWEPSLGCHLANGFINGIPVLPKITEDIFLLHYKLLSSQYRIDRIREFSSNLDQTGHKMLDAGINIQLKATDEVLNSDFERIYKQREKII